MTTTGRKVGELARASGLTVRTLHYYDEIGLVPASERSDAGYRLYTDEDVKRLYQVSSLRRLGLSLSEIGEALDAPDSDIRGALKAHVETLDRRLEDEGRLRRNLTRVVTSIESAETTLTNDLLTILEDMTMLDDAVQRRISILVYEDIEAAHDYLCGVFGLGPGQLTRDGDGTAVHAELQAGDGVLWLHPESPDLGLTSPRTAGSATASMAIMVDDVDEHHRHAVEHGATIVYEPVDQPYGYREYSALDAEDGFWSFMKPLD